jgi:hypothetical protein
MRQCPQCRKDFPDDTAFCLFDGTPLPDFEMGRDIETVVRPYGGISGGFSQAPAEKSGGNLYVVLGIGAAVVAVLLVAVIGLLGFLAYQGSSGNGPSANIAANTSNSSSKNNRDDEIEEERENLRREQNSLQREKDRLEEEKRKISTTPTPETVSPPKPPPPIAPPAPSVSTARINFSRGSTQASVSGRISGQRIYLLRASSGQYLSAALNSNGCVVFTNGGTSIGFTTARGDNRIVVSNNCGGESSYTMTVSIR